MPPVISTSGSLATSFLASISRKTGVFELQADVLT